MVVALDRMVAELMRMVGPDTLVVFTSDHGTNMKHLKILIWRLHRKIVESHPAKLAFFGYLSLSSWVGLSCAFLCYKRVGTYLLEMTESSAFLDNLFEAA